MGCTSGFQNGDAMGPGAQTPRSLHTRRTLTRASEPSDTEQESWEPRRAQRDAESQGPTSSSSEAPGPEPGGHKAAGMKLEASRQGPCCLLGNNGDIMGSGELSGTRTYGGCLWGQASQVTEAHGVGGDWGRPEGMWLVRGSSPSSTANWCSDEGVCVVRGEVGGGGDI